MPSYIRGQTFLKILTHLDILLFLGVLFGSCISEIYICKTEPLPISDIQPINWTFSHFGRLLGYNKVFLGNETENEIEDEITTVNPTVSSHSTIWEFRVKILKQALHEGNPAYHALYGFIWCIAVAYFVTEVWLYCVLLKGIVQQRLSFLRKWMVWRFLLLLLTVTLWAYDLTGLQATCTDIFAVPFSIFRIGHLFLVWVFTKRVQRRDSIETIIMTGTGSEKF